MTLDEFLRALPDLRERFVWFEDDMGMLRAFAPPPLSAEHSAITALAYVHTGISWEYWQQWEQAAHALGLSPHEAARIVSAEDNDGRAEPWLVRTLRQAVAVRACRAAAPADSLPPGED